MPIDFYWHKDNRKSQERIPRWLLQMSEGFVGVENAEEEVPTEASDEEEDNAKMEKHCTYIVIVFGGTQQKKAPACY